MPRTRSSSEIRDASRRELVRALAVGGTATRTDLARATGLSAATVSNLVTELREDGLIADAGIDNGGAGRPTTLLRIDGGGHVHASKDEELPWLLKKILGPMNHDVDTAGEAWRFFRTKSR